MNIEKHPRFFSWGSLGTTVLTHSHILSIQQLVGGLNPSEKYEFVSCDDYSQYMESHKIPWFQTTNQ